MRTLIVMLLVATLAACAPRSQFPEGEWIDLTYDFSPQTIYWPTSDPFAIETLAEGSTEQGFYYSAYRFCAAEHGGTHLDAPVHFAEGRKRADEIEIAQLTGPAMIIDVSDKAALDRDYQVSVEDLESWEARNGRIPDGSILLLRAGFGQFWPDREKYLGTERRGPEAVADLHFPGLHPRAASWIVANRRINAIGLDTASIDYGQSTLFESHVILLSENIPVFENVANLDRLPETGAYVIALPMKIRGGSGAPLRIVAFLSRDRLPR